MKVAVVGYGRMGHEVELVLRERHHEPAIVRRGDSFPKDCPVGIDFTNGEGVVPNVSAALAVGARYVVGATGWTGQEAEVRAMVEGAQGGLVHAANFSLGVGLFYEIVRNAASLMARFPEYDPYVLEKHHRKKKDAPSGTAQVLAGLVAQGGGAASQPATDVQGLLAQNAFHVVAVRAGGIVGEHTVGFDSGGDEILLEHRARSRRGFAQGAVLAAEWIADRRGVYPFSEVLKSLIEAQGRP